MELSLTLSEREIVDLVVLEHTDTDGVHHNESSANSLETKSGNFDCCLACILSFETEERRHSLDHQESVLRVLSQCDQSKPELIVPWKIRLPAEMSATEKGLKSIKPTHADCKPVAEDKNWLTFKEGFTATVQIQSLDNMIRPLLLLDKAAGALTVPFAHKDKTIDEQHCTWFCIVMCQMIKTLFGTTIVNKHRDNDTKDTR